MTEASVRKNSGAGEAAWPMSPDGSGKIWVAALLFALMSLVLAPALVRGAPVSIKLAFVSHNMPLKLETYHLIPGLPSIPLWETRVVEDLESIPLGEKMKKSVVVKPGRPTYLVLMMYNTSKETVYFFAGPHSANPEEKSLGVRFKCLCVGQTYAVPPGKYWYRVVSLSTHYAHPGGPLLYTHALWAVPKEQALPYLAR